MMPIIRNMVLGRPRYIFIKILNWRGLSCSQPLQNVGAYFCSTKSVSICIVTIVQGQGVIKNAILGESVCVLGRTDRKYRLKQL